jgi:hypothetical protein
MGTPRLKNRWQSPIGGFMFTEPTTGAQLNGWGFDALVSEIVAHRRLNPRFNLPTDPNVVAQELDLQNAMRMQATRGGDLYIMQDGGGGGVNFTPPPRRNLAARVAATGGRLGSGISVLADWLGDGAQTVPPEQANARAAICAKCPQNKPGDWTTWFTAPAAAFIKTQLEHRKQMKLTTPDGDKIAMCQACGCQLHLKVHVLLPYIKSKLSADMQSKLDPACWILAEK